MKPTLLDRLAAAGHHNISVMYLSAGYYASISSDNTAFDCIRLNVVLREAGFDAGYSELYPGHRHTCRFYGILPIAEGTWTFKDGEWIHTQIVVPEADSPKRIKRKAD